MEEIGFYLEGKQSEISISKFPIEKNAIFMVKFESILQNNCTSVLNKRMYI